VKTDASSRPSVAHLHVIEVTRDVFCEPPGSVLFDNSRYRKYVIVAKLDDLRKRSATTISPGIGDSNNFCVRDFAVTLASDADSLVYLLVI
jgi:hypothetical protein